MFPEPTHRAEDRVQQNHEEAARDADERTVKQPAAAQAKEPPDGHGASLRPTRGNYVFRTPKALVDNPTS